MKTSWLNQQVMFIIFSAIVLQGCGKIESTSDNDPKEAQNVTSLTSRSFEERNLWETGDEEDFVILPPGEEESENLPSIVSTNVQAIDPTIDVLVAYSPRARKEQGGTENIIALIQKGIADTNQAFEDSGVKARVQLVGTIETAQNESGRPYDDLYSLKSRVDGRFDEIHALRDRLLADQVTFVGVYSGTKSPSGIGFFNARADSAFTVINTSSFDRYTLAHELGHNLGLDHADGWKSPTGGFSTIMAYGSNRIRRFSNPLLRHQGHVTGSPKHNEAEIINKNVPRMATFR